MELINTTDDKYLRYQVETGSNTVQMKDCVGKQIMIQHILQNMTTNQDGEDKVATTLIDTDGLGYQTLSPTVADCCEVLYRIFREKIESGEMMVEIEEKKSKGGNRFLSLKAIQ